MTTAWKRLAAGVAIAVPLGMMGCTEATGPRAPQADAASMSTVSTVSQDRAQLSAAGVTGTASRGVFSIGWKKFVGPNIAEETTIGEAYAIVLPETSSLLIRRGGIDIGWVVTVRKAVAKDPSWWVGQWRGWDRNSGAGSS